jgi:hypothetical protein
MQTFCKQYVLSRRRAKGEGNKVEKVRSQPVHQGEQKWCIFLSISKRQEATALLLASHYTSRTGFKSLPENL